MRPDSVGYYSKTFDFGRDVDGAYTAQPYYPVREASEIKRWEAALGRPWNIPACDLMEDEAGNIPTSNRGCGPAWGDLCASGYFEEDR